MEQFDDFEFDKREDLGKGQYAIVYKGRFIKKPDEPVAIKAIAKKDLGKTREQLTKEIKILRQLSKLRHENVVALHKCAETPTHVYLVMEYCNGGDLADYLYMNGTLSEETIQHFVVQISHALETMHKMEIVHRDLKPQNILLCHSGRCQNPAYPEINIKLADFGFARFLNDGVMATTFCGSPLYMAPEVIVDQFYDARADLYSIGVIFFQCLTGKPPFVAQTPIQLKKFYERSLELTPNVPEWCSDHLRDLLVKTLKRNAENRMTFDEFFIHPFLKEPLKPTPSKRILESAPVIVHQKIIIPKSPSVASLAKSVVRTIARATTPTQAQATSSAVRRIGSSVKQEKLTNPFLAPKTPSRKQDLVEESVEGFTWLHSPGEMRRNKKGNSSTNQSNTSSSSCSKHRLEPVPVPTKRLLYQKMKETLEELNKPPTPKTKPMKTPKPDSEIQKDIESEREGLRANPTRSGMYDIENLALPRPSFVILGNGQRLPEKVEPKNEDKENGNNENLPEQQREESSKKGEVVDDGNQQTVQPDFSNLPTIPTNWNPVAEKNRKMSSCHSDDDDDTITFPFASAVTSVSNYIPKPNTSPTITHVKTQNSPPAPLDQEAFLGDQHKLILAKLKFVDQLVDSFIQLAEQKDNPLASAMTSRRQILTTGTTKTNTSSPYRATEQLMLYLRALNMLSSALSLAQKNVEKQVLQLSTAVKKVLNQLNEKRHTCLARCQELASLGLPTNDPSLAEISAERVIYRHAIDLCQAAALDELFGNPHLCGQRYQTAHMMLHTLAEQAGCDKNREVFRRYKCAVENRLRILERQGYVSVV